MRKVPRPDTGAHQSSAAPRSDLLANRGPRRSWKWLIGVAGLFVVGFAALAAFGIDWDEWLAPPDDMVFIPAGEFEMGSALERYPDGEPICAGGQCCSGLDSLPLHNVELDGFWMDRTPVTNAQFARFVKATHYVTLAEHSMDGIVPGSFVFRPPAEVPNLKNHR